jgi:excisionase family DNA binding protein
MAGKVLTLKPAPHTRRLLKTRDAASYLGVTRETFEKLVRAEALPVVQLLGPRSNWLVDLNDLNALIERQKTTRPQ